MSVAVIPPHSQQKAGGRKNSQQCFPELKSSDEVCVPTKLPKEMWEPATPFPPFLSHFFHFSKIHTRISNRSRPSMGCGTPPCMRLAAPTQGKAAAETKPLLNSISKTRPNLQTRACILPNQQKNLTPRQLGHQQPLVP